MFCGDIVNEDDAPKYTTGVRIGNQEICDSCLKELKEALKEA